MDFIMLWILFIFDSISSFSNENLVIKTPNGLHEFNIQIPLTDEEKDIGLRFRESVEANGGMLYLFPESDNVLNMF
jgi:uncharacterized membrane protein (UPF0127 family)